MQMARLNLTMQEAILRMKRADWMRPLLELLEGQARRAGWSVLWPKGPGCPPL